MAKRRKKLDITTSEGWEVYTKLMNGRIKAQLRKLWLWSNIRSQAIKNATIYAPNTGKRKKILGIRCNVCNRLLERNEVTVDHINAVGAWNDWNLVIDRLLFCPINNLQVLCKECHNDKTNRERA